MRRSPREVTPSDLGGGLLGYDLLGRFHHFGHSLAAGGGASGPDRDVITRVAATLKTREVQSSLGGAIAHWNNADPAVAGNGGYNTVGQQARTLLRPFGTLTANVAAGATTVAVSAPTNGPWANGALLQIGTGTNGEVCYVKSGGSSGATTLTLAGPVKGGQLSGEPVYEVPHAYEALNPLYLAWFGLNDVAASGTGTGGTGTARVGERAFKEAYRSILAKIVSSDFFDANHSSCRRGTAPAAVGTAAGTSMGNFVRGALANGNTIIIDVPANFAGGDLYVYFISFAGGGSTMSFTLDGAAHSPDLDTRNAHYASKWNCFTKIFKNVAAGRHEIIATVANAGANSYFAGWSIQAEYPPVVVCPGFNRPYNYKVWPTWPYTEALGTVGTHNAGVSSFTITAPLTPSGAAHTIKQGELITFDPGGPQEETLEVAADAAGTTVTTTTTSTKTHGPRIARPDSDVSREGWLNGSNGTVDLWDRINEPTPFTGAGSDYIYGPLAADATYEAGLSNVPDPQSSTGHIIRWAGNKVQGLDDINVTVSLVQGTTVIASFTTNALSTTETTYTHTLSAAQADMITDYTDLRLRFFQDFVPGALTDSNMAVTGAEFEVPEPYRANMHDQAIISRCLGWVPSVLADFPDTCIYVNVDKALNKQERFFVKTASTAVDDGAHFSDAGHGQVTEAILSALVNSQAVSHQLAARVSIPVAPLPSTVYFLGPLAAAGTTTAIGAANAVTEPFANNRHRRDMRRAVEARLQVHMSANNNPGQRGRVEYSLDSGTTWKTLAKKPTWADTAIGSADAGQVDLSTTGYKDTGWFPLPAEVWQYTDVLLRYVHGNRTSGTTFPSYFFIQLDFR